MTAEATFAALAEPRRRAMLLLVRDRPRSVTEIAGHFDITQQAVSQHLKVLREAGLVAVAPTGNAGCTRCAPKVSRCCRRTSRSSGHRACGD